MSHDRHCCYSNGPGRVELDLSMKTKTYFAFRIDAWGGAEWGKVVKFAGLKAD